jgi:MFS family permease
MKQLRHADIDSPHAWMTVVTAFMSCFTLFGVAYSFGAFFRPMGREFGASRMPTAAVFSITAGIYNALGAPAGHLSDRYGPRPVLLTAAFFMGTGLILTSRIDRLWVGYLTYGVGVGLGGACCYVPMVSVVGGWFARWRNTALGISVAGIGCGTLAMAPLAAALIDRYGWRETYIIFGVASAIILVLCALVVEPPPIHLHAARPRLSAAVRTPSFAMLWISSLLSSIAIYVPFVYLPEFAQHQGVTRIAAATLVGIIGGASAVGRMGLGVLADRTGIMWLYKLCTLALGLSYALWILTSGFGWLLVFALTMGTAYGGLVALAPAVVAEMFGVQGLGAMLGTLYTSSAISALVGPPLAGLVIDRSGNYLWAAAFPGSACVAGFFIIIPLRRASGAGARPGRLTSCLAPKLQQTDGCARSRARIRPPSLASGSGRAPHISTRSVAAPPSPSRLFEMLAQKSRDIELVVVFAELTRLGSECRIRICTAPFEGRDVEAIVDDHPHPAYGLAGERPLLRRRRR